VKNPILTVRLQRLPNEKLLVTLDNRNLRAKNIVLSKIGDPSLSNFDHSCGIHKEVQVSNPSNRVSEFFNGESETGNLLLQYVKSLSPDIISQLSKPTSPEVFQAMERNITGLLGNLPSEHFGVTITTNRENLGRLLASAMISGYFLCNAEQRMNFEMVLQKTESNGESSDD
jgi:hypothetical protein